MAERVVPPKVRPNTIAWAIVRILADGHWRGGADIRFRLECAGVAFCDAASVRAELGRLCRRGVLERTAPGPRNSRKFRLKTATISLGE